MLQHLESAHSPTVFEMRNEKTMQLATSHRIFHMHGEIRDHGRVAFDRHDSF